MTAKKSLQNIKLPPVYRKLWPSELGRLKAHLFRLDPNDRRMRFCGVIADETINTYCERIDWTKSTFLGCFIDGKLRGVADIILLPSRFNVDAELALSVEKEFQDQGIGSALLGKALAIARNRFIETAHLLCLPENEKMRHIAREHQAKLAFQGADVEGRVLPSWPSYISYMEEAELDRQTFWSATFQARD